MANAAYPKFKAALMLGGINLTDVAIKAVLLSASYTYNASHEFLSDISSGAQIAHTAALTNKTVDAANARFDSDDPVAMDVNGDDIVAYALYIDTGTASTSRLIWYFDSDVDGLPYAPDGSGVRIVVHANGWFGL